MASAISSAIPNGNSGTGLKETVFRVRAPQASEEPSAQTTLIVPVPEVTAGLVFCIVTENVCVPALPSLKLSVVDENPAEMGLTVTFIGQSPDEKSA